MKVDHHVVPPFQEVRKPDLDKEIFNLKPILYY